MQAHLTVKQTYRDIPDDLYDQYLGKIQDACEWLEEQLIARGIKPMVTRSVLNPSGMVKTGAIERKGK